MTPRPPKDIPLPDHVVPHRFDNEPVRRGGTVPTFCANGFAQLKPLNGYGNYECSPYSDNKWRILNTLKCDHGKPLGIELKFFYSRSDVVNRVNLLKIMRVIINPKPAAYCPTLPPGPASTQDPSVPWGGVVRQVEQGDLHTGICLGLNNRDYETPKSCANVGVRVHSDQRPVTAPSGNWKMVQIDFQIK